MYKIYLIAATLFFISCSAPSTTEENSNTDQNPCNIEVPVPSAEAQTVFQAETIRLSVQDNIYRQYFWTGPNGFTSNERQPEIRFATSAMSGLYNVYFKDYDCVSQTKSIQINVVAPTSPCSVTNNNMQTSIYGNKVYGSIYNYTGTGYYTLKASSSSGGGDLDVEFSTLTKPVPGLYKIVGSYSLTQQNEVKVDGVFSSAYIVATGGNVYVTFDSNGKMNVKFCNINFTNPSAYISNFTASANITEN